MTIQECYKAFGGNYTDVSARLMTEQRIQKFIFKFLQDQSFQNLQQAIYNKDVEEAFRAAHTLKGVSQNLSFDRLFQSTFRITEVLREQNLNEATSLFDQLNEDYQLTIKAIKEFQDSLNCFEEKAR